MNEAEINGMHIVRGSKSIEDKLKPDLDNFENRYRYLLRNTNLLYERGFHIIMCIFMTIVWSYLIFALVRAWYSYVLAALALAGIWYIFYLTEVLRRSLKKIKQNGPLLKQMLLRKNILTQLSQLRNLTIIHSCILLSAIWSSWPDEKRFSLAGVIFLAVLFILPFVVKYRYDKRVRTTRTYLNNILEVLESPNNLP